VGVWGLALLRHVMVCDCGVQPQSCRLRTSSLMSGALQVIPPDCLNRIATKAPSGPPLLMSTSRIRLITRTPVTLERACDSVFSDLQGRRIVICVLMDKKEIVDVAANSYCLGTRRLEHGRGAPCGAQYGFDNARQS
jgi:hypothetical protein